MSEDRASRFWARMAELVDEFGRMPGSGENHVESMYGFAIGIHPTDHPDHPTLQHAE